MNRQEFFYGIRILASVLLALLISRASALAQGALIERLPGSVLAADAAGSADQAWSRGVNPAQRDQARALFTEAAGFINEFLFEEAVAKYQEALAVWDHPAIHGNMSRALIALGRPLDAYRAAQAALRHGPRPLGDDEETRKRNFRNLRRLAEIARAQLAQVSVASPEQNIEVFIENEWIKTGADAAVVVRLPGRHRMSAQKTGHKTLLWPLDLSAGRREHLMITSVHRMTPWKPWAVLATGVGLTLAGTGLIWHAHGRLNSLEHTLTSECQPPGGCGDAVAYDSEWASVRWEQRIGAGSLILGAGGVLAGAALVWWNQQRRFRVREAVDGETSITPMVSPAMTGVSGIMRF